jgi:hypothetical protein
MPLLNDFYILPLIIINYQNVLILNVRSFYIIRKRFYNIRMNTLDFLILSEECDVVRLLIVVYYQNDDVKPLIVVCYQNVAVDAAAAAGAEVREI